MLKIVTDSSADMPADWVDQYGIHILPMPIRFGNQTYYQGVDLSDEDFYRLVRETGVIPKTSLPSVGQILQFYQKIAQPGETVFSLHVSSKMSGTFNAAVTAAKELAGRYKIIPFDSWSGSAALGFMCREVRLLDRAGASLQDIQDRLTTMRRDINILLTLDSLEFARMSGRINALKAALVSILNVKPIVVLRDGILGMGEKVRTRSRSIERMLELVRHRVGERPVHIAVVHCCDPVAARRMVERVCELFQVKEVILTELSISVAANLGPGTVGLVVYPDE